MHLRTWHSRDVSLGTRVFLRIDANVGKTSGSRGRLQQTIPEIVRLRAHGARILLASHLGDPKGKVDRALSVKPVAKLLSQKLGRPIRVLSGVVGHEIEREVLSAHAGEILMLENLRFEAGEETNDASFAKQLARLADVYVNNAFGVCHRKHASVVGITKELPSFAGELVTREVETLMAKPKHPFVVVLGGAKLRTKMPLLLRLGEEADKMLLGGAIALPFLKALDRPLSKKALQDIESEDVRAAQRILREHLEKILLPEDLITNAQGEVMDIGPKTSAQFATAFEGAAQLLWNGPLGVIEEAYGRKGTKALAAAIRNAQIKRAVVGGGETVEFLESEKLLSGFSHVSTGGGAMLALLSGEKLPGLEALKA